MCSKIKRLLSFVLIFALILCSVNTPSLAQATEVEKEESTDNTDYLSGNIEDSSYYYVSDQYEGKEYKGDPLDYNLAQTSELGNLIVTDNKGYEGDAVLLDADKTLEFQINVPQEGLYYFNFDYYTLTDSMLPAELSMQINGEYPYYELRSFVLKDNWVTDYSELAYDRYGNEIIKKADKYQGWLNSYINDTSFRITRPLGVYLKAGENQITLKNYERSLLLGKLTLYGAKEHQSYQADTIAEGDEVITIEAECPTSKNDPSIRAKGEFNKAVTPYKDSKIVLNMIDAGSFKEGGQQLNYNFDVKEAGYYYIGFHYRQSNKISANLYRDVYVDNEILYSEMEAVPFKYSTKFAKTSIKGADGNKIAVYLEEGTHEISLVVSLTTVSDAIYTFERIVKEINDLSLQVKKLTGGGEEDKYRDFEIEEYIPDIKERLTGWADEIHAEWENLCKINNKDEIGEYTSFLTAEKSLRKLAKEPNDIPANIEILNDDTTSARGMLASAIMNMYKSELDLDKIYIYQESADLGKEPGFFSKLFSGIKRFFLSFFSKDYAKSSKQEEGVLNVWVNRSRQYVEIMQKMVDESFTPETGIKVKLSLMPDQNKLVLAKAAGTAPDVAASISMSSVYDLAIRGALMDFRTTEDFSEIAGRFQPSLFMPSVVEDGIYAVPETFDFLVTYYRSDILEANALQPPDTWEDVYKMLPNLQRNGMNYATHISQFTFGIKPLSTTLPYIYQYGGEVFGDSIADIQLDSQKSLKGLDEAVKLFTVYNAPYEVASFFQHFRDGSVPIGISGASTYIQLLYAAPEIADSWNVSLYPGVYDQEKNEVVRYVNGAAEGLAIFESSDMKEEALKYVEWWTRKEVQVDFSYSLQAAYGKEYLWMTANIEAFKELPIKREHKDTILEMMSWIKETQRIPGTYMIERELSNTFNNIILSGKNSRGTITEAIRNIDNEVRKKAEEFGYMKDGKIVKEYPIITEETLEKWLKGEWITGEN
ncbi:MAG: transporter permease subunit [Herbinix sp.]|nr:transporter permease subunit [Herbinix sp.]